MRLGYFWQWSSDGSVMYVKAMYVSRFLKRLTYKTVAVYYTSDYTDVQAVAEEHIERLQALTND